MLGRHNELPLNIAGAAIETTHHGFRRQNTPYASQFARTHADFIQTEFLVERLTVAKKRRTHREQQRRITARIIRPAAEQQPGKFLHIGDIGIRNKINLRLARGTGNPNPRFNSHARS